MRRLETRIRLMDPSHESSQSVNRGRRLAVTGAVLQLGPVVGLASTLEAMRRAFAMLEASEGVSDPQRLDAAIGDALVGSIIGVSMGFLGLLLLFVALMGCRYRTSQSLWYCGIGWRHSTRHERRPTPAFPSTLELHGVTETSQRT